jgi:hypothetical protein
MTRKDPQLNVLIAIFAVMALFGTVLAGAFGFVAGMLFVQLSWEPAIVRDVMTAPMPTPSYTPEAAALAMLPIVRVAVTEAPTPVPTETPTAIPTATETMPAATPTSAIPPTPTKTPFQLPTPIVPTAVPPTPPLTPGISPEVQAYASEINAPFSQLVSAMGESSRLLGTPDIANDRWKMSLATQLYLITDAHDRLMGVIPPAATAGVHASLTAATKQCSDATDRLATGIDNFDTGALREAMQLMQQCTAGLNTAESQLRSIVGQ